MINGSWEMQLVIGLGAKKAGCLTGADVLAAE